MGSRKASSTDFESRYFDLLNERSDRQDDKLEKILEQVRYTNGRVTKLEGEMLAVKQTIKPIEEPSKKDLPPVWEDKKFRNVTLIALAILSAVGYAIQQGWFGGTFK